VRTDHLEFEEALPLLSVAAEADPGGLSRRRFLQGALAAAAGAALPVLRPRDAAAAELATPLGPTEGVLVSVFLGGGNDGLNTVAPISGPARARYQQHRASIAVPAGALRSLGDGWGLHPKLPRLHRRFQHGRAAVIQGVGYPEPDLSHFTAMAKAMQGRVGGQDGTGWLGRFVDGLPDGDSGMRSLTVGSSVPMTLVGRRARSTSVPSGGAMWGADRSDPKERPLFAAIEQLGSGSTGLGVWGDRVAAVGRDALADAGTLSRAFRPDLGTGTGLGRDLLLAARLINLDLGARVLSVSMGGFDTHTTEPAAHEALLGTLDAALELFFANLAPRFQRRTAVLVQSEFGRRPHANGALGTDHGTAAPMLLLGENVRGGVHGQAPDLGRLDDRGNLVPTVDFRAVYAELVGPWLGGDPKEVVGGGFASLGSLFAAGPGSAR
jgi:uncharacterized protein (DUF1501 family)